MSDDDQTAAIEDPPDWFGADGDPVDGYRGTDETPQGADWFDDLTYLDPTPGDAGESPEAERPATAASGDRTGTTRTGSSTASADDGSGTTADTGTAAGGTAGGTDGTGRGDATGAGGEVFRDEQGRQVRQPAEPDETDDGGGIIAWLKRLLGLN